MDICMYIADSLCCNVLVSQCIELPNLDYFSFVSFCIFFPRSEPYPQFSTLYVTSIIYKNESPGKKEFS